MLCRKHHPLMKNIVFVFRKSMQATPQVSWAIREYIDPGIHQILLIYILSERLVFLGDIRVLPGSHCVIKYDERAQRASAKECLDSVRQKLVSEFSNGLCVVQLVLWDCSNCHLDAMLSALDATIVILGPDTAAGGLSALLNESIDDFLVTRLKIPVIRVPGRKNARS